ncbi:LysR family transcriptional regulator [Pantoea sp. Ap-967]|uniref:LysR substrate-binding domain-containing protein n=1 Tax=Pantoea sp. Ap-967 TaxID=2608362 RepID=UPI0014213DA8|nr:LysR substrate-binding domain-containing protein [Pantoea sp. Ap-967]NIE75904.1 LysR family transcriptional regulator [Pantoea sp. Ap-967]
MVKHTEPDQSLINMPSLRAVKAFVAAAKYQNFTRAAESLCVTQAAISRQIRDLEIFLNAELFDRVGRTVALTSAGTIFFDAVQLSLLNISQASDRIRKHNYRKRVVTVCCTPAFASLWLTPRLSKFLKVNPDIDVNLVTTQNFLAMEPGVRPDIFVSKLSRIREGYCSYPLVHDVIYPVCTPDYLRLHPEVSTLDGIKSGSLLNLSPYGRAQVAEHVDWYIWFGYHDVELDARSMTENQIFSSNDYNALVQLALRGQGVALGWHYLVEPFIEEGALVRPVQEELVHKDSQHYLTFNEEKKIDDACCRVRDWILSHF